MRKMDLLFISFLLTFTEAKRRRPSQMSGVDIYPQPFKLPVSFGNVYREGFVLPNAKKNPMEDDPLEDLALENLPNKQNRPKNPPGGFGNPRDEYLFYLTSPATPANETDGRMWFDFPALQERNMFFNTERKKARIKPKGTQTTPTTVRQTEKGETPGSETVKSRFFKYASYDLAGDPYNDTFKENWTTCNEFAKGANFHPEDIIDMEWVPFYIWSYGDFLSVAHTFSIPTIKLVSEYRATYGPLMDQPIDWEAPKLLMHTLTLDTLLIAADRTGKFHGVIGQKLPDYVKYNKVVLATLVLRLKIEDPYLAMMHCDDDQPYAVIMAAAGHEPTDNHEKREAAETLGFIGQGFPVSRNVELERREAYAEKLKPIFEEKRKRIYLHRNYGMFPPPGASQEDEPEFKEPKKDSIVPDSEDFK